MTKVGKSQKWKKETGFPPGNINSVCLRRSLPFALYLLLEARVGAQKRANTGDSMFYSSTSSEFALPCV